MNPLGAGCGYGWSVITGTFFNKMSFHGARVKIKRGMDKITPALILLKWRKRKQYLEAVYKLYKRKILPFCFQQSLSF